MSNQITCLGSFFEEMSEMEYADLLWKNKVPEEKIGEAIKKFSDGTWKKPTYILEPLPHHRLHVSVDNPEMIAYFREPTSVRAVVTKPGRYIEQFFKSKTSFFYALKNPTNKQISIVRCEKRDDFRKIYTEYEGLESLYPSVSGSCMRGKFNDLPAHPAEVYGAGDIAIIAIRRKNTTVARLMMPKKNPTVYSRVYGGGFSSVDFTSICAQIEKFMFVSYNAGRKDNCLNGCKILNISVSDSEIVCPYIDDYNTITIFGNGEVKIGDLRGGIFTSSGSTEGIAETSQTASCENCGNNFPEESMARNNDGYLYCQECYEDIHSHCSRCGQEFFTEDDSSVLACDSHYCGERCANRDGVYNCDHCGEWSADSIESSDGRRFCDLPCAQNESYQECSTCGSIFPEKQMVIVDEDYYCEECAPEEEKETESGDSSV